MSYFDRSATWWKTFDFAQKKCVSIQQKCNYVENNLVLLRGLPFIPYIDALDTLKRHVDGPFMMPIVDKYSEMGTVLIGKVGIWQIRK